jgi:hypothetical protein
MKQKEIQERNEQIALLLGYKKPSLEYKLKWTNVSTEERLNKLDSENIPIFIEDGKEPLFKDNLVWHCDWNWLMNVVHYSCTIGYRMYFVSNESYSRCVFTDMSIITQKHDFEGGNIIVDSGEQKSDIKAVFIAVSDFAKLYNNKEL